MSTTGELATAPVKLLVGTVSIDGDGIAVAAAGWVIPKGFDARD